MTELDRIVAEAADATNAPVAFIGFVSDEGERIQSARGWNVTSVPSTHSFATLIASEKDLVVVSDATRDPRFARHPLVTGAPHVRFYAGMPIIADGKFVGALSVMDRIPRGLEHDQVVTMRLLARRIARELEMRREVEELSERFREFFEQTDDLIMSIGANGRVLHANEAVGNTLGLSSSELRAQPLINVVDPEHRPEFRNVLTEVFESGEPRVLETVFNTPGGRRITVEGSLRPRVIDGKAVLARVIFRDISERKEFEAELGNARDAALDAARVKTHFLANVSHEIRTPMNGIVGMVDLLLSTKLGEEQRDFAVQARASADQLLTIVNNILYVSNVEATGLGSSNVDFDLYRMVQRIDEVMKVAALGKDVDVSFDWDEGLPAILRGNQSKLRQVLTNLMENAIKFTEKGRVVLSVAQQTETETHRVVLFEVRDTGTGISQEDRLMLFERFSQLDSSSTRRYQGTGLGLATARHLVETLGGLIDVESKPGKGSTFWFSIPFPKQGQARKPIASSDLEFKGKRVLLVDSLPTSRKIIRHYLEQSWEMRVDEAGTGADALRMLRSQAGSDPIRVVIFDKTAELDPIAFAKEVRNDERIGATGLVHLAARKSDVNRETMRAAGINAFAVKPLGQGELFDALAVSLAHDAIPLARAAIAPPSKVIPKFVSSEMRRSIRVLLAEDNFLNAKLTLSQLQKLGYEADSVPNGREVLDAIQKSDYRIILMDCQMPIVDGYQASIEIRRRERETSKPPRRIIAMTANALEGDREKCLAAGMDDYLSKPTRHEDLEFALARYFSP